MVSTRMSTSVGMSWEDARIQNQMEKESKGQPANPGSPGKWPLTWCMWVSCQLAPCIMNTTDELATWISEGDVTVLQTSDLGLFWHDSYRYKVWAGVRVGQKVPPCVWGECEFCVNWLHVSCTHWLLNDDFDINQRCRRLTRNILIGVCVCVCHTVHSSGCCHYCCQLHGGRSSFLSEKSSSLVLSSLSFSRNFSASCSTFC